MNIIFLSEYAYPHAVSGAEYSLHALAEGLRRRIKVVILSPDLGGRSPDLKFPFPKKIKPGRILSPLWFNNPFFWFYSAYFIIKTIRQKKIDLIHVHGKYILPGAVLAGWLTHKPVVATVRDFKFLCPLALCFTQQQKKCGFGYYINKEIPEYQSRYGGTAKWKLVLAKLWQYKLKWFLNRCQQVIAVSPQLAKIYQDNGVKKVSWIYNLPPLRQAQGHGPRQTQGYSQNKRMILSVGKLSFGKGTDCLIKAAEQLPQYQFIFCGNINPSFKSEFPKNCKYLGKLSHEQTLKLYEQASAFAILSRWPEPLSRAGLEALSFGLPIVASNRGGNQELVKDNGYLVDPEKPDQVAEALVKAMKNTTQFSQKSLELLQTRFNRQQIINQYLALYRRLT
ncbi:MAG: glycosyltransferase family 4 protein [Candidatus Beckwithbacteria bacterium]|nr:glycosyltransferase family 4 protein [Candidatus Beckwithbacteria bacterium]